jgi:hypothetical protein
MANTKPKGKKPQPAEKLLVRTCTLARQDEMILEQLSGDASDYVGRKVSGSAIMRSLLRFAAGQGAVWQREHIFSRVEHEMTGGTTWGSRKR